MVFESKKACEGKANYLLRFAKRAKVLQERPTLPAVMGKVHQKNERACLNKVTYVVQGFFHQGDGQFSNSSAGKQCSCNALLAVAFLNMYDVITPSHINKILQEGDELYRIIRRRLLRSEILNVSERLTTKDLPSQVVLGNVLHKFKHSDSLYSRLRTGTNDPAATDLQPLHVIVQHAFSLSDTNIMAMGNDMITLFNNRKDRYGIFDPHSRNNIGMPTDDGHAVLLYFPSLSKLVDHLYKLADSLSLEDSTVIEIKPITISSTMQTDSGAFHNSLAFELFQRQTSEKKVPFSNNSTLTLPLTEKSKEHETGQESSNAACEVPSGGHKQGKRQPSGRRKKLKVASDSIVSDTSGQMSASSKQPSDRCKTTEGTEIVHLTRDVQKLEIYLNLQLQKTNGTVQNHPTNCSKYTRLSILTAAKIILLNKPRAKEVMQMNVSSFMASKLDPGDDVLQRLSCVEKKLCERLEVVKVPNEAGQLVPILLTPQTKKTVQTLVETRSQVDIDPSDPYLFTKCRGKRNSTTAGVDVLNKVARYAGLLQTNSRLRKQGLHLADRGAGLFQDVRLQKHVAAISQIITMENNELDWLKSHIADIVTVDGDFNYLQFSTLLIAKVVQLLHAIETGQAHLFTKQTWSRIQLSDVTSMTSLMQEPHATHNSDVTSMTSLMQEPHATHNSGERGIITEDNQRHQDVHSSDISDIPDMVERTQEQTEEKYSDVLRRANIPIVTECTDEPIEEKYADVLRRKNLPVVTECKDEPFEEKYADVLRRTSLPSTPEDDKQDQTDDKSLIKIRVDLSRVFEEPCNTGEAAEEKYSDVVNRDGWIEMEENSKESDSKYKTGFWSNEEIDALRSTLGSFVTKKKVPDKLHITIAQDQQPVLKMRRWMHIRNKIIDTFKNEDFVDYR